MSPHSKIESYAHKGFMGFEHRVLLPAYLGLINKLSHRDGIQITGEENLWLINPASPVIIGANHLSDNDVLAIARAFGSFDELHIPGGTKTILYSTWHEHNGKLSYKEWVKACRGAGFNMRGVMQAYRKRSITPQSTCEEGTDIQGHDIWGTIADMLKPSARSFLFPTGTRSADGTLLPAEESLGIIIAKAAARKINLQLLPMGIIPQDISQQSRKFSLKQKTRIVFGKPVTPEELIEDAKRLAKECDISLEGQNQKLLYGLIAHAFMQRIPLPDELKGVYHPTSPYYRGVLRGEIKSGMRVTPNGGYEVLLVKPNSDTTSETKWLPAKPNQITVHGAGGQLGGMFVETLGRFPLHEVSTAHRGDLKDALGKKPDTIILAIPNPIDTSLETIRDHGAQGLRVVLPQNGVDAPDRALEILKDRPDIKVYVASVTTNVSRGIGGEIIYNQDKLRMGLAPLRGEKDAAKVATLFEQAGHEVKIFDDYKAMIFTKLFINMINLRAIEHFKRPLAAFNDPVIFKEEVQAMRDRIKIMHAAGMHLVNLPGFPGTLLDKALSFPLTPNLLYFIRSTIAEWIDKQRNGTLPAAARLMQKGQLAPEVRTYLEPWIRLAEQNNLLAPSYETRLLSYIAAYENATS